MGDNVSLIDSEITTAGKLAAWEDEGHGSSDWDRHDPSESVTLCLFKGAFENLHHPPGGKDTPYTYALLSLDASRTVVPEYTTWTLPTPAVP
jgi:hypothetical protein